MAHTKGSFESDTKIVDTCGNAEIIPTEKVCNVEVFTGGQVYENLFLKHSAQRISKIQVILASVISTCQVMTLCTVRYSSSLEGTGIGIWASFITVAAAACVVWTCKKITYMRLHFSMALHFISIVAMMFLLLFVLSDSIPTARHRLYYNYLTPNAGYGYHRSHPGYNYIDRSDNNSTTESPGNIRYYSSEFGPIGLSVATLVFYVLIAVSGMAQLVLSIIMASMTCKAMCVGRKKIEETLFSMKSIGHGNPESSFGVYGKSKLDKGSEVPLPPPYNKITLGLTDEVSVA